MHAMTKQIVTDTEVIDVTTTVETHPKVIQFQDILDACEIVPDYDYDPFDWDGLEHSVCTVHRWWKNAYSPGEANVEEMYGRFYHRDGGGAITVDPADVEGWGTYDGYRARGATKQVAQQLTAQEVRRTIDYIRKWYQGEGEAYGVTCDYLGGHDSCWGYDDYEYARTQCQEHAENVARALEEQGYIVEGKPEPSGLKYGWSLEEWRKEFKRRLNSQNAGGR